MKKIFAAFIIGFVAMSFIVPPTKAVFKVFGNCGMCKERIESALDQKGIKSVEWNVESKMIEVVYVPEKISLEQINKIINGVGHDTETSKAADSIYQKLPDCCLYREKPNTHTN